MRGDSAGRDGSVAGLPSDGIGEDMRDSAGRDAQGPVRKHEEEWCRSYPE